MPAIPVHARVEAHMADDELNALLLFLGHAIVTHQSAVRPSPLVWAAAGDQLEADAMFRACKAIYQAADLAQKERAA